MLFRQFIHDDLGCASYLVGDEHAGVAAVVDPRLDVDGYLGLARYSGVRIEHIIETHTHADHVSGHGRLAAATGATIHIHRDAAAEYPHDAIADSWELELGLVLVRAIHTPGHRPEHTAFALIDRARGEQPWALLTGDSLFVGDLARPDLAIEREEGARQIFHSLHDRLLTFAPEVEVWPGHVGGSLCGGPGIDLKISSTIGYEHARNPKLAERDEDRFVAAALAGLGPQPPNFRRIVDVNRGPLGDAPPVDPLPLTPRQLEQRRDAGALVVDVRTDRQFDEAHVPDAVGITALRTGFGSRLAWIAASDREVVIVGRDDDDARRAAALAAAVGVTTIAGRLAGGMTSWREERRPVESIERIDVAELHDRLRTPDGAPQILDVRERSEWDEGHIPGSLHVPYHDIDGLPEGLDPQRPVATICASGQRAAVAAGLVQALGVERVLHVVDGGVGDWQQAGWPIER